MSAAEVTFTEADQRAFARLSGDANPIHVDGSAARRTPAGGLVVHGVHLVLWALEVWATSTGSAPARVRATFRRPVRTDDVVRLRSSPEDGAAKLELVVGSEVHCIVSVEEADAHQVVRSAVGDGAPDVAGPSSLEHADAAGRAGSIDLVLDHAVAAQRFPTLLDAAGEPFVAAMLAASRIVGMEVPGLHSLLTGFDLAPGPDADVLTWSVARASDPRTPISLRLDGALEGSVAALFRPRPVTQPSYDAIRRAVLGDELAGQRALVVGGSRGLGEVAAKVIASGGGEVLVTYLAGAADAAAVADEIGAGGGRCSTVRLDVTAPTPAASDAIAAFRPTHVYYFATPAIHTGRGIDAAAVADMQRVYVDGFLSTCDLARRTGAIAVLYPSSVYVAAPPAQLGSYAVAKAGGEAAATWADRHLPDVTVLVVRFDRLRTDQTAVLIGAEGADALEPVLGAIRELRDREAASA